MNKNLEVLVTEANNGNRNALGEIVAEIKDLVYNLSLKMLLYPEDAKDATQDILVKVITHLSTFKGNSQFKSWVYRIATNYLLTAKGKKSQAFHMPFEDYEKLIDAGQSETIHYTSNLGEISLLEEEVKVSCTHGLLLCLDAGHRIVYILGEILGFNSLEGAAIMTISAPNFRKQLSRSRKKIRNFLTRKCGLVNPANPCRCSKKIDFLISQNVVNPVNLRFAHLTNRSIDLMDKIMDLDKSAAIYKNINPIATPEELYQKMKESINKLKK